MNQVGKIGEVRMPFKRLLEANVFSFNSANHHCQFDKISVVLPWETALGDTTKLNLLSPEYDIVIHEDLTPSYPHVVSQESSESLKFGSRYLDINKATESDSDSNDSSASMTEHSNTDSPKGKGRCGCANCRETNTRVSRKLR
jgi:hypothetical protein